MKELINVTLFKRISLILGWEWFSREMAIGITFSIRDKFFFGLCLGPIALVLGIKKTKKS